MLYEERVTELVIKAFVYRYGSKIKWGEITKEQRNWLNLQSYRCGVSIDSIERRWPEK